MAHAVGKDDAPIGEDLDMFRIFLIGTTSVIITTVIIGVLVALYYSAQESVVQQRVVNEPYALIRDIRETQKTELNAYGVAEVEPGRKSVTIPIDEAIRAVAAEHAGKNPR